LTSDKRAVRKSLIAANFPCLVEAYKQAAQKAPTTPSKKRAPKREKFKTRSLEEFGFTSRYSCRLLRIRWYVR